MAKQPAFEVRLGRIKAVVWENETKAGVRHNVQVSRLYRDEEQWKSSSSFGRDDLPLVAKVCDLAHSRLYESNGSNGNGKPEEEF